MMNEIARYWEEARGLNEVFTFHLLSEHVATITKGCKKKKRWVGGEGGDHSKDFSGHHVFLGRKYKAGHPLPTSNHFKYE